MTNPKVAQASAPTEAVVDKALNYLHQFLDTGDSRTAPDWAVTLAGILTGANVSAEAIRPPPQSPSTAKASRKEVNLADSLLEALTPRIAHSAVEAASMAEAGISPIWCLADSLNPCWDERRELPATTGPLRHWGGGDPCSDCRIRHAFVECEHSIREQVDQPAVRKHVLPEP